MDERKPQLQEIHTYIQNVEKEMTLILQSLQWDQTQLLENKSLVQCKHDKNHKVTQDHKELHEDKCLLKSQGYSEKDKMLLDPLDANAPNVIKLNMEEIKKIIRDASIKDSNFKMGDGCEGPLPRTVERLQSTYTADERRAIYDAVIHTVPSTQDLIDLSLPGNSGSQRGERLKSQLEMAAELRDMKRRRTKYRVAPKTKNYSIVLRDVIKTQMELYVEAQADITDKVKTENEQKEVGKHRNYNEFDDKKYQNSYRSSGREKSRDKDPTKNRKKYEVNNRRIRESNSHNLGMEDRDKKKVNSNEKRHRNDSHYYKGDTNRHPDDRYKRSYSSSSRHRDMEYKRYYDSEHYSSSHERKKARKLGNC